MMDVLSDDAPHMQRDGGDEASSNERGLSEGGEGLTHG